MTRSKEQLKQDVAQKVETHAITPDILHADAQRNDDTLDILAQDHRIPPDSPQVIPDPHAAAQRDDSTVTVIAWSVYAGLVLMVLIGAGLGVWLFLS